VTVGGFLYRYQESRTGETRLHLYLYRFPIVKVTPCGVQISVWGSRRFVLASARKRYACPTEAEALESYRARKRRQIGILRHRLAEAEAALRLEVDGQSGYLEMFAVSA
jgi:hypothetical protein